MVTAELNRRWDQVVMNGTQNKAMRVFKGEGGGGGVNRRSLDLIASI